MVEKKMNSQEGEREIRARDNKMDNNEFYNQEEAAKEEPSKDANSECIGPSRVTKKYASKVTDEGFYPTGTT